MCEFSVAFVAVSRVCRHKVEIARAQVYTLAGHVQPCGTFRTEVDAGKGRRHVLPVPVAIVTCQTDIEHL